MTHSYDSTMKPNLNTIVGTITLGVIVWVGTSLLSLTTKVNRIEAVFDAKNEQLNRIEAEVTRQRAQIYELQLDMARIKPSPVR